MDNTASSARIKLTFLFIAISIFFLGCVQEDSEELENLKWTIEDILKRPELYEGKNITIKGTYRGWETNCSEVGPPVTRGDWQLDDESGCIYVTGLFPNLDPYDDVGVKLRVEGVIRLNKMKIPYIEAIGIEILEENLTEIDENETSRGHIYRAQWELMGV